MKFIGIESGDYESHCFDVDRETFIKIKGEEPDEFDESYFNPNTYRVYISEILKTLLPDLKDGEEVEVEINIKRKDS